MPRTSRGIIEVPVVALFAVSGPATPSILPLPNSSGNLDSFFSNAYETKVEMTCEIPGTIPNRQPITVPRPTAGAESLRSLRVGVRLLKVGFMGCRSATFSRLRSISLIPKRPNAIATKLMPSITCKLP